MVKPLLNNKFTFYQKTKNSFNYGSFLKLPSSLFVCDKQMFLKRIKIVCPFSGVKRIYVSILNKNVKLLPFYPFKTCWYYFIWVDFWFFWIWLNLCVSSMWVIFYLENIMWNRTGESRITPSCHCFNNMERQNTIIKIECFRNLR